MDDSPFSPTTLYTISLRKDKVQRTIWHNTWLLVRCTFVSNLGLSQCVSCLGGPRKARHLSRANWYCWPISAFRKYCLLFLVLEWNFPTNNTLTLPACSHCRLRLIQKCIRLWAHNSGAEFAVGARQVRRKEKIADPVSKLRAAQTSAVCLFDQDGRDSKTVVFC